MALDVPGADDVLGSDKDLCLPRAHLRAAGKSPPQLRTLVRASVGSRPRSGVNETGVGSLQDLPVIEGRTYARACPSMCATRHRGDRMEVKGLHRLAVAAAGRKPGAA
jgi:hypothetical protein